MLGLDDYIDRVKDLPPAPRLLPELLSLLGDPDVDSSRVVALISYDPALTAHVLRLCNSALLAAQHPVSDLQEAVVRLGFEQIYRLVAAVCGSRQLSSRQKGYGIRDGELWEHSVTAAVASQLIARDLGEDANLVFTTGLLHDIGKIVLSEALENRYVQLIEEVEQNQQSLLETERILLGVQHAEIGGRLLERWNFPSNLTTAVCHHHDPANANDHSRLASMIYLGNMIAYFMGSGYGHPAFALRGRAEALEILRISGDQLPRYMIQTHDEINALQVLYRIAH
ncbi:MAG: HDOD domain-containing protein [Verrucomicrobiota bacterium]